MSDFNSVSYLIKDFLETFSLPQSVRVLEGYNDEFEWASIGFGAVYNLMSLESIETVLFEDVYGEENRVPVDYPCTIEHVAEDTFQQELTIKDLAGGKHSNVKFVRVTQEDPNFETLIKAGEKLKIEPRKKKSGHNFLSFKKVSDREKTVWKIPGSCEAKFHALRNGEETMLSKFVNKNKLPVYVRFVRCSIEDIKGKNNGSGRTRFCSVTVPNGIVKLKGIVVDSFVLANTEVNGEKFTYSLPKTLAIRVVPLTMDAQKSPNVESSSNTTTIFEEYEDMSGFHPKMFKLPAMRASLQGGRGVIDTNMSIACEEMEFVGHHLRRQNTYSPPPSCKATRSKRTTYVNKGSQNLLQRTASNWELRNIRDVENEENVYETLNFDKRPLTGISKSCSLSRIERRKSDSYTDQESVNTGVSKQSLKLSKELAEKRLRNRSEKSFLEIRKTPMTFNKTWRKMETFGWKESPFETESAPLDVNNGGPNITIQSYSMNKLTLTATAREISSPFYGSLDTSEELYQAPKEHVFLAHQISGHSSEDTLPLVPALPVSCAKERKPLPCWKETAKDVPPQNSTRNATYPKPQKCENRTNQETGEHLFFGTGIESDSQRSKKKVCTSAPVPLRRKRYTPEEIPCPDFVAKGISSENKVVGCGSRKPVPLPRKNTASLHSQEQRKCEAIA